MAFRKPKQQPRFADLRGILAQTKETENPLYQTVQELINRLTQFQAVTLEQVADINDSVNDIDSIVNITADKNRTYLTTEDETLKLPFSFQLLAGTGITFTDAVHTRTISSNSSSGGFVPMSTGAEPLEIMSNGAGVVLLVAFNE